MTSLYRMAVLSIGFVAATSFAPSLHAARQPGDTLYSLRFRPGDSIPPGNRVGVGRVSIEGDASGGGRLHVSSTTLGSVLARFPLSLDSLRGARVTVFADVEFSGVSKPRQPWSGVKAMLVVAGPRDTIYAQQNGLWGTLPRSRVSFLVDVPVATRDVTLMLGLEDASGDVFIRGVDILRAAGTHSVNVSPVPRSRVSSAIPRLRGAMVDPGASATDLRTLGVTWRANVVRWQLRREEPDSFADRAWELARFDAFVEAALTRLDEALPAIRRGRLAVILDLHSPPGGVEGRRMRLFADSVYQRQLVDVWERIARRYRGDANVIAFDLLNEPMEGVVVQGADDWNALAARVATAIRRIDPDRVIVVEAAEGASPRGFANLRPVDLPDIMYSVHMYEPLAFTHQGIGGRPASVEYPGVVDDVWWDRGHLQHTLRPVREFQRAYGARILVGEFSAVRWAPRDAATRYVNDLIRLFDESGWDWIYHAYRECTCWSVEHDGIQGDERKSATRTNRESLLRRQFQRNTRVGRVAR